jgi:hypothetical protein
MQKKSAEEKYTKWAYKKLPTYKTLYRIIWNTPNAEILKRNFTLLSNPLVLVNRILRGWP